MDQLTNEELEREKTGMEHKIQRFNFLKRKFIMLIIGNNSNFMPVVSQGKFKEEEN